MMRPVLADTKIAQNAQQKMAEFHSSVVAEVSSAIATNKIVVVGMAQNPFVKKVKRALTEAQKPFHYIEYGNYFSQWKPRLAIKLWSGWPTFPQVFVEGRLIGGYDETVVWLQQNPKN